MIIESSNKQIESTNQKSGNNNLIVMHKENFENNYLKPSNDSSSKNNSASNYITDMFSGKEQLESYIKKENPQFLEKFEILEILKSGSVGKVVKASYKIKGKKNASGKIVALKFLNNYKEKRQNHSEIIIHGSLKCRNIPEIFGYYKIGNNCCICMELGFYGDLENFKRRIIKRTPLSETLICYILGGISQAVFYIHTHNKIIHMDIKQQNVIIDDYVNIKLTDYSVSYCYKDKKKIKLPMVGTCYYMSPEVLRKDTIDASDASKIDVYSIGVLLYLLAFNDYPYKLKDVDGKNYDKILENIEKNELEFPKGFDNSKIFLNLLKKCLNKDIKKRYNIYQLMKDPYFEGYQIILNEKEKMYNASKFVVDLMVDNILNFNQYIQKIDNEINNFL